MGYTHYWYRKTELDKAKFAQFVKDVQDILHFCDEGLGIKTAGPMGTGKPVINQETIALNGSDAQPIGSWTTEEDIVIPWPSDRADIKHKNPDPISDKRAGTWYAGDLLDQRTAPINPSTGLGKGSYETFDIPRVYSSNIGPNFSCCKTAYRPYDIPVTAILLSFLHYFPDSTVRTNGQRQNWADAVRVCRHLFGYGSKEVETIFDEKEEQS